MHPDIAYHLADQRHAELIAAVAHQRLVDEAKQAHAGLADRRPLARRWWWALAPNRALAAE
jgi:hypothetical protein